MLKTERNTARMKMRILRAFRKWYGRPLLGIAPMANFEHGQWWITNALTGAQWAVVDATGGNSVDGFDFELVTHGEEC